MPSFGLSIRARLALWYATVFAVSLGAVSVAIYEDVAQRSLKNMDANLYEATSAVATAIELEGEAGASKSVLPRIVREFRFRDLQVAVYDPARLTFVPGEAPAEESDVEVDTIARDIAAQTFRMNVPGFSKFLSSAPLTRASYASLASDEGDVRAMALPHRIGRKIVIVGAVHRLRAHRRLLAGLQLSFGVGIPQLLVLATLGGYLLARKSLKPVAVMTERAAHISETTLHERLPVANPNDELGRLAAVFNELLARLGAAFDQQRQFIADASHELRTPVAIVSGEAELALSRDARSPEELRAALRTIREEMLGLQRVVEDLFLLARAHAGERLVSPSEIYLGELCAECVRSVRSLAVRKHLNVRYVGSDELPMRGDETLLRRLLLNLVDNAIKYTPARGAVTVSACVENGSYVVRVADTGGGVPAEARERVFDRFYRAQRAREAGEPSSGAGLGLAIAQWIAQAHGGSLTLERTDASGSVFQLKLPAQVRAPAPVVAQV